MQTVPGWLSGTPWRVVVVDYSCPDGAAAWASSVGDRVECVSVTATEHEGSRALFNLNAARHAGAAAVRSDWVAFVDADVLLSPSFSSWATPRMRPGTMVVADQSVRGGAGLLIMTMADYSRSGGFDIGRTGYGPEEYELRVRMRMMFGLTPEFARDGVSSIRHGPIERLVNYRSGMDPLASWRRMEKLVLERFGVTLREAAESDPVVKLLLGGR